MYEAKNEANVRAILQDFQWSKLHELERITVLFRVTEGVSAVDVELTYRYSITSGRYGLSLRLVNVREFGITGLGSSWRRFGELVLLDRRDFGWENCFVEVVDGVNDSLICYAEEVELLWLRRYEDDGEVQLVWSAEE